MIVDFLVIGAVVYGLAWLLNKQIYKQNPASKLAAYGISFVVFLITTGVLTALTNKLNFSSFFMAWIFYSVLNKVKKEEFEIMSAEGNLIATFDNKEKADDYIVKNTDKNYSIKVK